MVAVVALAQRRLEAAASSSSLCHRPKEATSGALERRDGRGRWGEGESTRRASISKFLLLLPPPPKRKEGFFFKKWADSFFLGKKDL